MPKSDRQKQKLLYILKYLKEETDENNPKTIQDIMDYLGTVGIAANVKTARADIEELRDFGYEIESFRKGPTMYYYLSVREFDFTELRVLVDVVQSTKFLSESTSRELIDKLNTLTSRQTAKILNSKVQLSNRVKGNITKNYAVYNAVDKISDAIEKKKKIKFKYKEWVVDKAVKKNIKETYKHDGKEYIVSPLALIYDDENYYLIAHEKKTNSTKHFRIDKIDFPVELKEKSDKCSYNDKLNKAAFSKEVFGMFGGETNTVELKASNYLIGVLVDRFSKNITIWPKDDGTFTTTVKVMLSPQFYAWVFGLGKDIEIIGPADVRAEFRKFVKTVEKKYKK